MKQFIFYIIILLMTGCFLFSQQLHAQNWDVNFVKSVNPVHPNSFVFKSLSASVYPVSITFPVATFIVGEVQKSKSIKRNAYDEFGSVVISAVIAESLKKSLNRQRPFQKYAGIYPYQHEVGESFPSGHATLAFAIATTLSLQYKKWYIMVPAYAWAAGCGFSRLYLGEHYTSDVIGGAVIGCGSAVISHWLSKKIFK